MIRPHYVPLYQSVCTSEKLADLASDSHRLFYVLLLTHADSWGRCAASARVLTAKVWPLLGKKASDTEKALADLQRVGLIQLYEVGPDRFLAVPDWEEKAGKVGKLDRRGPTLYPDPPPPVCRTSPVSGRSTEEAAGVVLPRARAQSEPSLSEQSQAEPILAKQERAASPPAVVDRPPRAEPTGPHADFRRWWCEAFERQTGNPYAWDYGKDAKLVSGLLKRANLEELQKRATRLLIAPPEWLCEGGVDIGTLSSQFNKLAAMGHLTATNSVREAVIQANEQPKNSTPLFLPDRKR